MSGEYRYECRVTKDLLRDAINPFHHLLSIATEEASITYAGRAFRLVGVASMPVVVRSDGSVLQTDERQANMFVYAFLFTELEADVAVTELAENIDE